MYDPMTEEESINSFRGEFGFLSNFHRAQFIDLFTLKVYKSSEHFYVACKARDEADHEMLRNHPFKGLKEAGRSITMRPDWENVKESVMMEALYAKFTQNEDLKQLLLDTGDREIIEGNTWHDQYWGSCSCEKHYKTDGKNMLGELLMALRARLKKESK